MTTMTKKRGGRKAASKTGLMQVVYVEEAEGGKPYVVAECRVDGEAVSFEVDLPRPAFELVRPENVEVQCGPTRSASQLRPVVVFHDSAASRVVLHFLVARISPDYGFLCGVQAGARARNALPFFCHWFVRNETRVEATFRALEDASPLFELRPVWVGAGQKLGLQHFVFECAMIPTSRA
jgi:hypothetical protein